MPHSFHPHLHPSFVLVLSSHQCENTQETFTTMGLFTHLLLIKDLKVHWRQTTWGGWGDRSRYTTYKNKHVHESGPWRALRPAQLAVMGPGRLCNFATLTQKACHRGFDEQMDIRILASFHAVMYGVRGFCLCFIFTSRGLSVAGWFGKAFSDLGHQTDGGLRPSVTVLLS